MKKFINNNDDFLKESLTGFGKAHSDIINVNLDPSFVSRKNKTKDGKVSLISGGGSGHAVKVSRRTGCINTPAPRVAQRSPRRFVPRGRCGIGQY